MYFDWSSILIENVRKCLKKTQYFIDDAILLDRKKVFPTRKSQQQQKYLFINYLLI